jgi:hypothetical protein
VRGWQPSIVTAKQRQTNRTDITLHLGLSPCGPAEFLGNDGYLICVTFCAIFAGSVHPKPCLRTPRDSTLFWIPLRRGWTPFLVPLTEYRVMFRMQRLGRVSKVLVPDSTVQ